MNTRDLDIVRDLPLFAGLAEERLRALLKGAIPRTYPKGKVLFQEGDRAESFFIVLDGWVKVFRGIPTGEEAVLGVFTIGESFAEAAMFLGGRYPASCEVVEDARLVRIRNRRFRDWIEGEPGSAFNMLASMSLHLHRLTEEVAQLKTRTAKQRVAEFLLHICPTEEGSAVVALPYEKALIAARLGMQPESLSRVLANLRELGVKTEHNRVTIADLAVLKDYCRRGLGRETSRGFKRFGLHGLE